MSKNILYFLIAISAVLTSAHLYLLFTQPGFAKFISLFFIGIHTLQVNYMFIPQLNKLKEEKVNE